jgi:hypothetical protein
VISRDLSETLPYAIWFVNAGEFPTFTISITWLAAVWKPKLPHLRGDKGGVKEWRVIMKPDGEGIADYKMVFCSDRSGFERVSGCRLLVSPRSSL